MRQPNVIYETKLNGAEIDLISERVREFLKSIGIDGKNIIRYTISIEEILIKSLETAGENAPVTLIMGKRFRKPFVTLQIGGSANNVYIERNEEQGVLGAGMLKNLGLSPDYSYTKECNNYTFRINLERRAPFLTLIIALALAFLFGFLGLLLPDSLRNGMLNAIIVPLHDTFLNILGCIAGPMVFLSVAWGIYGIGDAATLKQVGRRMFRGYISTVYIVITVLTFLLLSLPVFTLDFSGSVSGKKGTSAIFGILLGVVPENIFSPFVNGNTLQIIFLAIVIGVAMLFLGKKTNAVALAVEQINYIVQFLIEFISRLVPAFVFIVIINMIWSDSTAVFLKVGKLFITFVCAVLVMAIGVIAVASIRNRVNPFTIAVKGISTLLIAITTASSAAAFGSNMNACQKEYGINDKIASFGIPFGMVTFKPTTAVSYMVMSLFFSEMYGVKISAAWVVVMIFITGILAIATPPIPGGALTAYTVLFTELGIPTEALAIALACDAVFDFIDTGFDQYLLPITLLNQAGKLGMVDKAILKRKKIRR